MGIPEKVGTRSEYSWRKLIDYVDCFPCLGIYCPVQFGVGTVGAMCCCGRLFVISLFE